MIFFIYLKIIKNRHKCVSKDEIKNQIYYEFSSTTIYTEKFIVCINAKGRPVIIFLLDAPHQKHRKLMREEAGALEAQSVSPDPIAFRA